MTNCEVFNDLASNLMGTGEKKRIFTGLIAGVKPGTWFCAHGLIALLRGTDGKSVPYHAVNPLLIGLTYDTNEAPET